MVLIDSSVWVDYFNGRTTRETDTLHSLLGTEPIAIGDVILVEVLQGFRHDADFETAKSLLSQLNVYEMLGEKLALQSANHYRELRKRGLTVRKTVDVIIATFCIERRIPLLYSDRDFDPFVEHLGLQAAL
jgi:predicted nucleic acid-binding protein